MSNYLSIKIKSDVAIDKHRLLECFFEDWIDDSCNNQVHYNIERDVSKEWKPGMVYYNETFSVHFDRPEDALALKLRGIPREFEKYLEIVK